MNETRKPGLIVVAITGVIIVVAAVAVGVYYWPWNGQPPRVEPNNPLVDDKTVDPEKDPSKGPPQPKTQTVAYAPPPVTLAAATEFLHSGPKPVQVGMDPQALDARRAAALRGLVYKDEKEPFPGVHVSIQNQPRYGVGQSRLDGTYDMVVNGGGLMTVGFTHSDYLPVWRQAAVPWQDYTWLPPVVMTRVDSKVTPVKTQEKVPQVVRANQVKDKDGQRQTTLIFPSGTKATMVLPDGSKKPLETLHVRATEYTVGDKGPARMPAPLPPASGYTYCVELSADEAIKAGAKTVQFDRPVYHYVENFLQFPVGIAVPTGYFDPEKGAWIASASGRIIKILDIKNGLAELDVEDKGQTADAKALEALKISDDERKELARIYAPGTSVWRVPIPHFSIWDCNWNFSPPADAVPPGQPAPSRGEPNGADKPRRESVPVPGFDWKLHYHDERTPGALPSRTIRIPVTGKKLPPSLKRIEVEILVAGCRIEVQVPAKPDQNHTFTWDGKDAFGHHLHCSQPVKVRIGYVYDGVYEKNDRFGYSGKGQLITGSRTRQEVVLWQEHQLSLEIFDARSFGLGGWSFDVQHAYDPVGRILYLGNGERHQVGAQIANLAISTVAGGGVKSDLGDDGPALEARLDDPSDSPGAGFPRQRFPSRPRGLAVAPDGTLFIADANERIRRVDLDGKISTIAGGGKKEADNGRAMDLRLHGPRAVALAPDGSMYIAEAYGHHRVRRLNADGTLATVAGGPGAGFAGDGAAALTAKFAIPPGSPSPRMVRSTSPIRAITAFAASPPTASSPRSQAPAQKATGVMAATPPRPISTGRPRSPSDRTAACISPMRATTSFGASAQRASSPRWPGSF